MSLILDIYSSLVIFFQVFRCALKKKNKLHLQYAFKASPKPASLSKNEDKGVDFASARSTPAYWAPGKKWPWVSPMDVHRGSDFTRSLDLDMKKNT